MVRPIWGPAWALRAKPPAARASAMSCLSLQAFGIRPCSKWLCEHCEWLPRSARSKDAPWRQCLRTLQMTWPRHFRRSRCRSRAASERESRGPPAGRHRRVCCGTRAPAALDGPQATPFFVNLPFMEPSSRRRECRHPWSSHVCRAGATAATAATPCLLQDVPAHS